ncbi:hypothetical protein [Bradyrhizobium mercantei]|uniref:hypothetical protein n=1 Tax=Bradyrhizobium mercantei TaxID=1904807 RepID=UPI00097581CD|nr:hypothetical protein [Bradyrhizobium mercantei]
MADKLTITVVPRTICSYRDSRGDGVRIGATLVLRPGTIGTAEAAGSQLFENWPSIIHHLFSKHAFKAQLGVADTAGKLNRNAKVIQEDGHTTNTSFSVALTSIPEVGKDPGFGGLKLADITDIWNGLLKDGDHDMTPLRRALLDATVQPATTNGHATPNNQPPHPYQDVQQPADPKDPSSQPAPNIVGMPRAELAQQITMARAMAVIGRVKGQPCARQAFLGEGAYFQRPWSRSATRMERLALDSANEGPKPSDLAGFAPDGTPIIFAAANLASDAKPLLKYDPYRYGKTPEDTPDMQWSLIKNALIGERQDKEQIYQSALATRQGSAQTVHAAEASLLSSGAGVDRRKALAEVRGVRARHNTLQQSTQFVRDNGGNLDPDFLHVHGAATLEDYGSPPDANSHTNKPDNNPATQAAIDAAKRRWFALLGLPALHRLLLLSVNVDLSFRRSEFDQLLDAAVTTPDFVQSPNRSAAFFVIRLDVAGVADSQLGHVDYRGQPWTLAKCPLSFGEKNKCFMPATLEELLECLPDGHAPISAQDLRERGTIDQFGGVLDLEAAAVDGGNRSLRFSIETVDIHAATESDMRRDAAMANAADLTGDKWIPLPAVAELTAGAAVERKLRTAGLQLLDQWRGSVVVKQFSRSLSLLTSPGPEDLVLDADDLAIGYRLDVGFCTAATSLLQWACLTNREVRYSLPKRKNLDLNKAIDAALGLSTAAAQTIRAELDGSVLAMPTRLLQNADGNKTGFAEAVLAAWQGDPLGIHAHEQLLGVCPGEGLELDLDFNLPSASNHLPAKHRIGVPYWLGARTVFLGGVCLPLSDAIELYENGFGGGMLLPRQGELRRLLRHEWIDPPMVAVPWADIVSELGIATKPAAGKPQTPLCRGLDGDTMVVRTPTDPHPLPDEPDDDWRFKPDVARRAVCAPGVDFTFAHLHSMFDSNPGLATKRGLAGVDYEPSMGGFPAISPEAPIEDASIIFEQRKPGCAGTAPSGIAIFRARTHSYKVPSGSEELYFPDPAARSLVIGLRYPWTTDTYLKGAPIVVPLYGGGKSGCPVRNYPDAMPVLIAVHAIPKQGARLTEYQQLAQRAGGKLMAPASIAKGQAAGTAIEVTIKLAPGEDFCIDIWALHDLGQLAQWFDGPESVAFYCAGTYNGSPDPAVEKQKLEKMLGKIPDKPLHSPVRVIRRSDAVVSSAAVADAATALHATLSHKPIPELSAVRTLRAVHAVEQPPVAAKLCKAGMPKPELRFLRVEAQERQTILNNAADPKHDWRKWKRTDDSPSATDILAGGTIRIDKAIHENIELRVRAVSPNGRPMDNPLLGRTPEDRSRGLWPEKPAENTSVNSGASLTRRLYGFDVDEEGRVCFTPEEIVFNKWSPKPDCKVAPEDITLVDLAAESEYGAVAPPQPAQSHTGVDQPAQQTSDNGRRSPQRYFTDGTARRVQAYFAVTSRTARLVPERSSYPDAAQQQHDRDRLFAYERDARGKPAMTSAIIRSIVRPLALPRNNVLPAFVWTTDFSAITGISTISRRTRIRIPFVRPAMTSGEDERIGIVLWPPNILGASTEPGAAGPLSTWTEADLTVGKIRRAEPLETNEPQNKLIDLQALAKKDPQVKGQDGADWRFGYFSDEDLGPGGIYVSRWGADPIHDAGEMAWFMHPRAFRDLPDWSATAVDSIAAEDEDTGVLWPEEDRYAPRLVENVLMPIPGNNPGKIGADENQGQVGDQNDPSKKPEFMLVSLLTYAPRFDLESETWYIDVEIDPGTAPDPFLRLGLVRFQPHANRPVQVSYPVDQEIQVVGYRRDVKVSRVREGEVTVRVEGPVIGKMTSEAPLTIIRASLIERRTTEYGLTYEWPARAVGPDGSLGEPIEQVSYANSQSDDLIWEGTFHLPTKDSSDDLVQYAVFIEECYRMRRATFDEEPVKDEPDPTQRNDPTYWRDSGPRFAVRIDL